MHIFLYFYIFYIFLGLGQAQPMWLGWARTSKASPAWSLAQASDPAGLQALVVQTTRVLHRAKVIKLPSPYFLLLNQNAHKWR